MKENLFDVRHEDLPRWQQIRQALQFSIKPEATLLSKALDKLINLEITRNVATPSTTAKGKHKSRLSQEWGILQFNVPNIDAILYDNAKKLHEMDNIQNAYSTEIMDSDGRWVVAFIADEKTIAESDPSQIMAAVIAADDKWDREIVKAEKDRKNPHIEDDIYEALDGQDWPAECDFPPEGWQDLWRYAEQNIWPKKYIVVKTGYAALVLSRDLYEFIMFYLTGLPEDVGRLPCLNDNILARKTDFKPPSLMKNFRFDATNVRALESAQATAGGTLVSYIDDLLKTYLGAVVAKRLIDQPPQIGDAVSKLKEFNEANSAFGFTVVEDLYQFSNEKVAMPAMLKDHQKAIKYAKKAMVDAIKKAGEKELEVSRLESKLNEADYHGELLESKVQELTRKYQKAAIEVSSLKLQLNELNDNTQLALQDVEKEPVYGPKGGIIEAFQTRDEVADSVHEEMNEFKDKIVKLEKQFLDVGELKETMKVILETMKSKDKPKDK